jgi:pimeloyl-ACP methyl ester carboxylesterase
MLGVGAEGELVALPRGASIFAAVRGEGRPVVFISGLGDDHALFEPLISGLIRECRCLMFDNRGSGLSSNPPEPAALAAWAEDAHHLARELSFAPGIIVGCSMGGAIALEWALRYPGDIAGLVLISAWARTDPYLRAVFSHWLGLVRVRAFASLAESLMLFSVSPEYLASNPDVESELLAVPNPNSRGFQAQAEACIAHDTLDRLGRIEAPTLVISGRHDILTRPAHSLLLADRIPGATFESVAAAHVPFWERPQETLRLVTDYIAGL